MESTFEKSRKRQRNPSEWKREKRKRLRIAGKEYINSKGETVPAKQIGTDCRCRRKCFSKITEQERKLLFEGYYSLHSHDEQNAYLYGLIQKYDIARKKNKNSERRSCTYKYFLRIEGKQLQVCRLAFANIHGISPHKIRILCQKLDKNVMFPRDQRGKHSNRPKRIPENIINCIKTHIYSIIQSEQIHNFLRDEKGCSNPDINITKMWKDYLTKHDDIRIKDLGNDDDSSSSIPHLYLPEDMKTLNTNPNTSDLEHFNLAAGNDSDTSDISISQLHNLCQSEPFIESESNSLNLYNGSSCESDQETSVIESKPPRVKHWLYSKVFHEEFKFLDFMSLKKRLNEFKINHDKMSRGERKTKSSKPVVESDKSTADKLSVGEVQLEDPVVVLPSALVTSDVSNLSTQSTNSVFIPTNLPTLTPLSIIVPGTVGPIVNVQTIQAYPNYSMGIDNYQGNFVNLSALPNISFTIPSPNYSSTYLNACFQ